MHGEAPGLQNGGGKGAFTQASETKQALWFSQLLKSHSLCCRKCAIKCDFRDIQPGRKELHLATSFGLGVTIVSIDTNMMKTLSKQ